MVYLKIDITEYRCLTLVNSGMVKPYDLFILHAIKVFGSQLFITGYEQQQWWYVSKRADVGHQYAAIPAE